MHASHHKLDLLLYAGPIDLHTWLVQHALLDCEDLLLAEGFISVSQLFVFDSVSLIKASVPRISGMRLLRLFDFHLSPCVQQVGELYSCFKP